MNTLCNLSDSIFCIIDIQSKLVAAMPDKPIGRIMENTQMILEVAGILNIPVIASKQSPYLLGEIVEEITEFLPEKTTYFEKESFSCCGEKEFLQALLRSGRKQVILSGIEAHISVLQTALHLKHKGFEVFASVDTVGSRSLDHCKNATRRMQHSGVILTSSETLIFEWMRDANQDQLEAFSSVASLSLSNHTIDQNQSKKRSSTNNSSY